MSKPYTVKQIVDYVKRMFDQDVLLSKVSVEGEISNLKESGKGGHLYFTLKDNDAALSVVMFSGKRLYGHCPEGLKDGAKIVVHGSFSVYIKSGSMQLYADDIRLSGDGDLLRQFEELKKKLSEQGMFAPEYKKPIPKYAYRIGVATSGTGAAVHDIIDVSKRRNPHVSVYLFPTVVQGDEAPRSIIHSIESLDRMGLDVLIVGRGGGSFEDLNCFNDEGVARAIFNAKTPVISAVGHETDFTIADFVSDLRAPTPSAAAELAVFSYQDFLTDLRYQKSTMQNAVMRKLSEKRKECSHLYDTLKRLHPKTKLRDKQMEVADLSERMKRSVLDCLKIRQQKLQLLSARLNGRSPLSKLKNGYGYLSHDEKPVRFAGDVKIGDLISVTLSDGKLMTRVIETSEEKNG